MAYRPAVLAVALTLAGCMPPPGPPSADAARSTPLRYKGETASGLSQHTDTRVGADLDPALSPDGKWLAFCSTRHEEQPEIYLKAVDGVSVIRRTFQPCTDCQPAFSPDGKRIAFSSDLAGEFDLYVMSAFGREPATALTQRDGDERHPTWSPDGSKIAYSAYDARLGDWELRVLDVATRSKTYLGIVGLNPEWSPDGSRLAFQRARERGERWYSVWTVEILQTAGGAHIEARNPAEVVEDPSWGAVTPSWSRDGRHLVFVTSRRNPTAGGSPWRGDGLWTTGADGTCLVRLTLSDASFASPCWGADDRVYFVSDRSGHKCLWSLKPTLLEALPGAP